MTIETVDGESESVTYISTSESEQVTFLFPHGIKHFAMQIGAQVLVIQEGELNYCRDANSDWVPYPSVEEEDGSSPPRLTVVKKKN